MQLNEIHDMTALRAAIDALDVRLIGLLAERRDLIARAAQIKSGESIPARVTWRVEEVVANARRNAEAADLDPDLIETIWRQLIEAAIAQEDRYLAKGDRP